MAKRQDERNGNAAHQLVIQWSSPDDGADRHETVAVEEQRDRHRAKRTRRIAELNDLCRTAMGIAGRVMQTQGICALPRAVQSAIRERVETFDEFTPANDPHGERDLGSFECEGHHVLWKIDYYDREMEYGSEDPSDPSQTTRVLTIMLSSEY